MAYEDEIIRQAANDLKHHNNQAFLQELAKLRQDPNYNAKRAQEMHELTEVLKQQGIIPELSTGGDETITKIVLNNNGSIDFHLQPIGDTHQAFRGSRGTSESPTRSNNNLQRQALHAMPSPMRAAHETTSGRPAGAQAGMVPKTQAEKRAAQVAQTTKAAAPSIDLPPWATPAVIRQLTTDLENNEPCSLVSEFANHPDASASIPARKALFSAISELSVQDYNNWHSTKSWPASWFDTNPVNDLHIFMRTIPDRNYTELESMISIPDPDLVGKMGSPWDMSGLAEFHDKVIAGEPSFLPSITVPMFCKVDRGG